MNLHRDILWLAVPSIVSNITVPLLGLVDVAIMGHIGDARFIGAIAVGSMIFNVMYWLFGFLRMGTSGLTAQAYGRESRTETALILRQSLTVALGIGLLIVLLQWPLRLLALWLMQPSEEVARLVTPYYNICVWGAPAVLGLYAMTGWYVGMQNTRIPMMVAITQNIVNIQASLFFVFVLHMQVEGVALGTLVAQWTGFALSLKWRSLSVEWKVQSVEFATARQDTLNEKTDAVANSTLSTLHSPLSPLHRCNFVYVPQGNTLLSGTLRDNLRIGAPGATDAQMHEALRLACADFVSELPDGLDTKFAEQGGGLSEGQAQRIAIARALLRPGSIILLDEATSALDADTERQLLDNILRDQRKTVIFVTHRQAVIEYCDRVIRID